MHSHAGAFAQATAMGGTKDPKIKKHTRQLIRTAYPEDMSE